MTYKNEFQIGYFISFAIWSDALELLRFQVKQKQTNRHYRTLSMFCYEKLNTTYLDNNSKTYFENNIANNLFYGLKAEFSVLSYVIPKSDLGLRDYKFLTYPMKTVYYAVGLYLLKLSHDLIAETHNKSRRIESFYGGNLKYQSEKLNITKKNIYYREFHEEFERKIQQEIADENQNKIILRLDIENYFNEISIPTLLDLLDKYIKPSIKSNMLFDAFTKKQIIHLFQFISNGKLHGIPQSDNDIISSFVGYLYLIFGDLLIDDIFKQYSNFINTHKIIRYTDDIYISMTFKQGIKHEKQSSIIYSISSQISEILYNNLNLRLNSKTKLYYPDRDVERKKLIEDISEVSLNDWHESYEKDRFDKLSQTPQEKLEEIFKELEEIKESKALAYFAQDNKTRSKILKGIFDKSVEQLLNKAINRKRISSIFANFDFDKIRICPLPILVLILKDPVCTENLTSFYLNKDVLTVVDTDLMIKFLSQINFDNPKLIKKLKKNSHMNNIIKLSDSNRKIYSSNLGYYNLKKCQVKKIAKMPEVIEQIKLRILSEKEKSYSVALNHLLNEIHAVCRSEDKKTTKGKKDYEVANVINFLNSKHVPHHICMKIRNLFDRRNSNGISHPGFSECIVSEVAEGEYWDYYKNVGECLNFIYCQS
jgi:AbiA family abortive infection protein